MMLPGKVKTIVKKLAINAYDCGLDGIVCSPKEIDIIRKGSHLPDSFKLITPGVRPTWSSKDDQKRIVTPSDAIILGTDYIVIGRPIITIEGAQKVLSEVKEAMN